MRVNVVVKRGWILERCAEELVPLGDVRINAGHEARAVDRRADLTYYMPARDVLKYPCPSRAVGFYTHGPSAFDIVDRFAACVTMNRSMAALLRSAGAANVVTIRPGTDPTGHRAVFGVCGRVWGKARKGESLVRAAVEAGFDFRACTDYSARGRRIPPCPVTHSVDGRALFYASIDYLVVTSTDEGGPMPVLEAIAHGVPVIAPDVGWCWEFPVIRYAVGEWESLRAVLEALTVVPTWEEWRNAHGALFRGLAE